MNLPSGTITFLFTDIEGSTKLWEQHPEAMQIALARHDSLLRQAIEQYDGHVFKTVGDAFCAAFATAPQALAAALAAHLLLQREAWGETGALRVRMGLHTGEAQERDGDYFGPTLNRVARLQAVGHGQQTLLSQTTHQLIASSLLPAVTLLDLGQQRLKDLLAPEHVWQLCHPDLPAQFPPLKSLDYLPTNLPRQMTSFIGREQEMEQVQRLLPATSLVTLLGSGGAGKTRLALQVGAEVLEDYKEGVWLVELAALSDPALVAQTTASALGLREEHGRPLLATLQDYLKDRTLLLILDNCEHLVEACARFAQTLLTSCRGLTILATSREPIGIAGEHPWRVPSLLTPAPDDLPMEEKDIAAVLMEYDACRLFVERAVVQRQDFVLTRSNVPTVALLCRQLDGIPLAIELAAARIRSLSVEEINNKLDNRFRLLTGGSRTALPRQQTLRALIDWSYDLLNEQEKRLLGRLSVFVGGWTLEAAEQVGAGESAAGESIEDWEVLDLLTSLADKSLVIAESSGESTRYRLLETVRQYAWERLTESGEALTIRLRHRDYFLKMTEEIATQLEGSEQAHWLNVLEQEHDNLRLGLTFCQEEGAGGEEEGLRLGGALGRFWEIRGHLHEGSKRLSALLDHPGAQEPTKVRARALNVAGNLVELQGDYPLTRSRYEESLMIYRELGDKQGIANTLNNLGNVAFYKADYIACRVLYEESLTIYRELGNNLGIAIFLNNLGMVAGGQGDHASARSLIEESLTISRELGNKQGIAYSLWALGKVERLQGDPDSARSLLVESLRLNREIGNRQGIADSLGGFASLAVTEEKEQRSAHLWGASMALREAIGYSLPANGQQEQDLDFALIEQVLGQPAFSVALEEGRAMTLEQAIEYALAKPEE